LALLARFVISERVTIERRASGEILLATLAGRPLILPPVPKSQMTDMEEIVKTILAIALAASQTIYYEAKVETFGCSSIDAVSQLQKVRSDEKALQAALVEKQLYGECVAILQGTRVQGSIEATDNSILRVNQEIEPPGYEAPAEDFEAK
jgi:hypothetical protein